jgi:predicted PurR-regulated permease PerM
VLSLDDRTGNVLTTVGLFAAVVAMAYAARATLIVLVLALLMAYLLEPAVGWVQGRLPLHPRSRETAIALVYLIGASLLVASAFTMGPAVARQVQRLNEALPELRARVADSQLMAQRGAAIVGPLERVARTVVSAAEYAGWLLIVPVFSVFFLTDRNALIDGAVDLFSRRRDRASAKRTVEQIDSMLAHYTRAQSATAGLSAVFYTAAMALLNFPYPFALGVLGGALEFVPFAGWILAAAAMLTSGWLAHAHWIWMAGLIVVWRIVMNVVITPRVLGDRLQMEPMAVFLALMAGGQIAGLAGVILSVPTVAVLRILWSERASRENAAAA